jgi:co-chaperonin GroES (HSP10)
MLNIKKVKLLANYVLVTKREYDGVEKENGVVIPKGNLKEYQEVIAVGPMVRTVQVGDLVCVNPKRYAVYKYKKDSIKGDIEEMQKVLSYNFNVIKMDGEQYMLITDQDIDFVIEEYEENKEEQSTLILPKNKIIT